MILVKFDVFLSEELLVAEDNLNIVLVPVCQQFLYCLPILLRVILKEKFLQFREKAFVVYFQLSLKLSLKGFNDYLKAVPLLGCRL
jgi:hypothetical protein